MATNFDVLKRRRLLIVAAVLAVVLSGLSLPSYAGSPEQRCSQLGGNCLCSEPLQMTGFTRFSDYLKPNDSTTKACNTEGVGDGYTILRQTDDLIGSSDATILSKLPTGNSVARVLKGPEGHNGIWNLGHMLSGSDPTARYAVRWYLYYSPNFQFDDKVTCMNSQKWMVGSTNFPNNPQSGIHSNGSLGAVFHQYAWSGWSPSLDCCPNGTPGYNPLGPSRSLLPGRWWRFEVVVKNRTGPSLSFEVYVKNVTDNTAEVKVLDTTIPCVGCGNDPTNDWSLLSGATSSLVPPTTYRETRTEHFRNGPCAGFYAVSHYMSAAWSTNAGQRIGAALEVEGGATPNPSAPGPLTVQ